MSRISRRTFCATIPAVYGLAARASSAAGLVNDRVRLGMIGCGGRMRTHLTGFAGRKDCEIAAVCDVEGSRVDQAAATVHEASGARPTKHRDLRAVLDDASIDAVVISTPDHWHCLASIWACQAGKDVYVEKPVSHSVWEGGQLLKAARKHDRVVQVGTQNRSGRSNLEAKAYLESGALGRVELVRVFNQENDPPRDIGPGGPPPADLDWDAWLGPAPQRGYHQGRHRKWRCFWDYAGGDVTDDTIHQLDLACMLLGVDRLPKSVHSVGFAHEHDEIEVANTLATLFEFDDLVLMYNQTQNTRHMLKSDPGIRNGDLHPTWQHSGTRIEIVGERAQMYVGRHGGGWQVFDRPKSRRPVVMAERFGRFPDAEHHADFIDAVRTRRRPNADIQAGHLTASLCHLANISFRLGNRPLKIDPENERVVGDAQANALLRPERRVAFEIPDEV